MRRMRLLRIFSGTDGVESRELAHDSGNIQQAAVGSFGSFSDEGFPFEPQSKPSEEGPEANFEEGPIATARDNPFVDRVSPTQKT